MKLATFEVDTPVGPVERIGAAVEATDSDDSPAGEATLVDLTAAYGATLEAEGEPAPADLARAHVPPEMIAFLERGDRAIADAREALEYAAETDAERGPGGATLRYEPGEYRLLAPLPRPNSLRDCMAIEEHVQTAWTAKSRTSGTDCRSTTRATPTAWSRPVRRSSGPTTPRLWTTNSRSRP
nr:hypothetical protein [Natrinema sp. SYSU A 869]